MLRPPPASNRKRKIKAFPIELANVTDDHRSRFSFALELDPNPRSKYYGSESLVAQAVAVNVDNREVVVDLKKEKNRKVKGKSTSCVLRLFILFCF